MTDPQHSSAHLRIKHPTLDPAEITRRLAIAPEHTLEAGRNAAHPECYWIGPLTFEGFDEPFLAPQERSPEIEAVAQLSALQMMGPEGILSLALRRLQTHRSFFQRLQDDGGTATILITTDRPGAIVLQPSVARKLADTCLTLELDWSGSVE